MWKNFFANTELLAVAGIVIFGAIVHATSQLKIKRDNKEPFTTLDFIILWILGVGSGLICYLAASIFFDSQMAILLFSLSGSVLGMAGTNAIATAAITMLANNLAGKSNKPNNDEK